MLNSKTYLQISGLIFLIVALLHLSRLITGWSIAITGEDLPGWISVLGLLVAGYLAYSAYKLSNKKK